MPLYDNDSTCSRFEDVQFPDYNRLFVYVMDTFAGSGGIELVDHND